MKARIKEDDTSVPYFYNGYYYITRYETGKDYPIYTRRKESMKSDEEVLFDVNEMAKDYAYYYLRGISISPDNKWAAYAVDTLSRRNYIIHVKNLETGEVIEDAIPQTTGTSTWGNDNKTLFYARKDAQSLRPNQIYRHSIGERVEDDELLYTEEDETYVTYVYKTRSRNYIVIGSSSTLSDEFRILDANTPLGEFRLFQERIPGLEFQRSEEHTSELQSRGHLVCRLLLEKKKILHKKERYTEQLCRLKNAKSEIRSTKGHALS